MNNLKLTDVIFRHATINDCADIVRRYSISSDGVADYVWTVTARPGEDIIQAAMRRYQREDTDYSYKNCLIAEVGGSVAAMMLAYPMHMNADPDYKTADPVLLPYARLEQDNSYYISGMAVFPQWRGYGIGSHLLGLAEIEARSSSYDVTSLIVFEQNLRAKALYDRYGYSVCMREPVVAHPLIHYTGDALLMIKRLDN